MQPEIEDKGEEESDGPTRGAIYARTSSPNQKFGYSLEEQVDRCWEKCQMMDWDVRYIHKEEAESGGDLDRPKFKMMMDQAKAGAFDVIVFWKLDRFCRSLIDLLEVEEKLREWGVGLHSITEQIDTTTPVGRFNFRNLASAA
ncbi:resolvase, partial [candidate division MSBL1 archaeon SCGC-AAA382C18]